MTEESYFKIEEERAQYAMIIETAFNSAVKGKYEVLVKCEPFDSVMEKLKIEKISAEKRSNGVYLNWERFSENKK